MNLAILISGRGSNLEAILRAVAEQRLDASPCVVISNRNGAGGLEHAAGHNVPRRVVSHRDYASREEFDRALLDVLRAYQTELVALAGFDRIITPVLLAAFPDRIVNIHPSLLPAFPGLHAQRQAVEYGVKVAGCTVHLVDEKMDHGPILAQAAVDVHPDDTEESLAARILEQEHRLYPEVLQRLAAGDGTASRRRDDAGRRKS